MKDKKHIMEGETLKQLRIAAGYTRQTLADQLQEKLRSERQSGTKAPKSISASMIGRYERGEYRVRNPIVKNMINNLLTESNSITTGSVFNKIAEKRATVDLQSLRNIATQYGGKYLIYRPSFGRDLITTVWLNIESRLSSDGTIKYMAIQKTGEGEILRGEGLLFSSTKNIYLLGWRKTGRSVEMASLLALEEGSSFKFLHGLVLTSTFRGDMFSTKIVCERLPDDATFNKYENMIGNFAIEGLKEIIDRYRKYLFGECDEQEILTIVKRR